MFLNIWRIRFGIIAAGLVLLSIHLILTGGSLFPGTSPGILIEFGAEPQAFEGLQVEIDGHIVGELKRYGQATRTAFDVSKGEHMVRVVSSSFECPPVRVSTTKPGERIMLLLNFGETTDERGRPVVTLRG